VISRVQGEDSASEHQDGHRLKCFSLNRHNNADIPTFTQLAENYLKGEEIMNNNAVIKLNFTGPQGQEIFLAVDFTTRQASVLIVDPRNGNLVVTDVQSIATRGN
jgi:hypothetical protein